MIDDIKKSISSTLYERTTSPFFGTLICSWLLWNWKIVYLTLFISEKKISGNKIDYIMANLADTHRCITYPILSTFVLLTIIPFVSNGAYWLNLKFTKWRKDKKNEIEMKQLLTLEQSIELREQISEQETRFERLLENKNLEIKQLNAIIEESKTKVTKEKSVLKTKVEIPNNDSELERLVNRVKNNSHERAEYDKLTLYIQKGYQLSGSGAPDTKFIALMESYDIIKNVGSAHFQLTESGKMFHRLMEK